MTAQRYSALSRGTSSIRPLLSREGVAFGHNFLRDQFTIRTWLLLGALLQALLVLLPIRTIHTIVPVIGLLSWQVIDAFMMSFGLRRNVYMDNVAQAKYTALIPDEEGNFTRASVGKGFDSGGKGACVFILGFRINHPLGVAAPGAWKIMQYFTAMQDDLETNAAQNGFLSAEYLLNAGHRTARSEIKSVWYFRSIEHVMSFAHSPIHRRGWEFYNKAIKKHNHLGIMHEMYESPAGQWENIYVNQQPVGLGNSQRTANLSRRSRLQSLIASASFPIQSKDSALSWVDPLVEARKGRLASTAGRLGKDLSDD